LYEISNILSFTHPVGDFSTFLAKKEAASARSELDISLHLTSRLRVRKKRQYELYFFCESAFDSFIFDDY
jgi:hypothetical protein